MSAPSRRRGGPRDRTAEPRRPGTPSRDSDRRAARCRRSRRPRDPDRGGSAGDVSRDDGEVVDGGDRHDGRKPKLGLAAPREDERYGHERGCGDQPVRRHRCGCGAPRRAPRARLRRRVLHAVRAWAGKKALVDLVRRGRFRSRQAAGWPWACKPLVALLDRTTAMTLHNNRTVRGPSRSRFGAVVLGARGIQGLHWQRAGLTRPASGVARARHSGGSNH